MSVYRLRLAACRFFLYNLFPSKSLSFGHIQPCESNAILSIEIPPYFITDSTFVYTKVRIQYCRRTTKMQVNIRMSSKLEKMIGLCYNM